jgi:hypothetical protein
MQYNIKMCWFKNRFKLEDNMLFKVGDMKWITESINTIYSMLRYQQWLVLDIYHYTVPLIHWKCMKIDKSVMIEQIYMTKFYKTQNE